MKNILILGYGKSGQAVFDYLKNKQVNLFVYDQKFACVIQKYVKNMQKNAKKSKKNAKKPIYFNNFEILKRIDIDLCVISPGINLESKEVKFLKKNNVKIMSELEFGAKICKGKIIAITGTNGKTTTCNLVYEILKTAGKEVFLCGNVGTPITEIAPKTTEKSILVVEVSSFQMETTKNFKPYITGILNIKADHLDRHKSLKKYINLKDKINEFYGAKKVFNCFDDITKKISKKYLKNIKINEKNVKICKKTQKKCVFYKNEYIFECDKVKLIGEKNLENVLMATAICKELGVENEKIQAAVYGFSGLPHRLNIVEKFGGTTYINDSKSTNVASTVFALESCKGFEKIALILGGSFKDLDFNPLFGLKQNFIAVCYGEIGEQIYEAAKKFNFECYFEKDFKAACQIAFGLGCDLVLLSPASASFDQFLSYAQRGEKFCEYVREFCNIHTCRELV